MTTVFEAFGAIKHCELYGANHPINVVMMASSSFLHYTTSPNPKDAYALIFRAYIEYMKWEGVNCSSPIYGILKITRKPRSSRVFSYDIESIDRKHALATLEKINNRVNSPWISTIIICLRHQR